MTFSETSQAIAELATTERYSYGEHTRYDPTVASMGISVGHETYDPTRHDPFNIDYFSIMGMVTGEEQVRVVQPDKPFWTVILRDETTRRELASLRNLKQAARAQVSEDVYRAMPMTDYVERIVVSDEQADIALERDERLELVDDRSDVLHRAAHLALEGALVVVISDFHRIEPASQGNRSNAGFVAVKVNHVDELTIRPNQGFCSLGGTNEINTNKPRILELTNRRLRDQHDQTVEMVTSYGGSAATIVVRPNLSQSAGRLYKADRADRAIAGAVRTIPQ